MIHIHMSKNIIDKQDIDWTNTMRHSVFIIFCNNIIAFWQLEIRFDHQLSLIVWTDPLISNIVEEAREALWKILLKKPLVMPGPNEEIWKASEKVFREKWNFPQCVTAIDRKHVRIEAPAHGDSEFLSYKTYHSVCSASVS